MYYMCNCRLTSIYVWHSIHRCIEMCVRTTVFFLVFFYNCIWLLSIVNKIISKHVHTFFAQIFTFSVTVRGQRARWLDEIRRHWPEFDNKTCKTTASVGIQWKRSFVVDVHFTMFLSRLVDGFPTISNVSNLQNTLVVYEICSSKSYFLPICGVIYLPLLRLNDI